MALEANFDGLVGPTHGYAGLSPGNIASLAHRGSVSSPKTAALEGLAKMRLLRGLGIPQGVLPPHERPNLPLLRRLGFCGTDAAILERASREAPHLLASACSASAMWAANAATVAPSADTADGLVHFTVANLTHNLHRSIEAETTSRALRTIFGDASHFAHHAPLPSTPGFGDEGAANHTRLVAKNERGVHLFVYGRDRSNAAGPKRFPARQTL
ncbi:MAG: N-succinylarginine dihydrolase, partial [Polyangiaceae bacterium]|nr:N-succinylarginine dihydrolase [Polyangiaceae bacterium]